MQIEGTQTTSTKIKMEIDEAKLINQIFDKAVYRLVKISDAFVNNENKLAYDEDSYHGSSHEREIKGFTAADRDAVKQIRKTEILLLTLLRNNP